MGQVDSKLPKITRNLFEFKYAIGRGGFGKVWKVAFKKTGSFCAWKEMSKLKIIDRKSEKSIWSERILLSKLRHPFLVNMICAFQDRDYLYWAMDLLNGGDLRYHICRHVKFSEEQTKFFMACLILGLEYIHGRRIIHRDIKPENWVCEDTGYIRITDFGVAKKLTNDNKEETSGTPGYMSPEVLCAQNHGFPVDYYALGVIGYEFMLGRRPYPGRSRKEIKQEILTRQVQIKEHEVPFGWSVDAADWINRWIQRKVRNRLGYNGIEEIKTHIWFSDFDWNELMEKRMTSPFIPKKSDNFDKKYCESEERWGIETVERYQEYRWNDYYLNAFNEYTCTNLAVEELKKITTPSIPTSLSTIDSLKKAPSNNSKQALKYNKYPAFNLNLSNLKLNGILKFNHNKITFNQDNTAKKHGRNKYNSLSDLNIHPRQCDILNPSLKFLGPKNHFGESDLPFIDSLSKKKNTPIQATLIHQGIGRNVNHNTTKKSKIDSQSRNKQQFSFNMSCLIRQDKQSLNSIISKKTSSYSKIANGSNRVKGIKRSESTLNLTRTQNNYLSQM